MDPVNIDSLQLAQVHAAKDDRIAWAGAFPAYGGAGASQSATVYFTIAPGQRLGGHTDTTEETQFIVGGKGELVREDRTRQPLSAGDVVVLAEGEWHDVVNVGTEPLRIVGFFAAPAVNQHFDDVMLPGNSHVTGSPNAPQS